VLVDHAGVNLRSRRLLPFAGEGCDLAPGDNRDVIFQLNEGQREAIAQLQREFVAQIGGSDQAASKQMPANSCRRRMLGGLCYGLMSKL
jgi:hypothetical protein